MTNPISRRVFLGVLGTTFVSCSAKTRAPDSITRSLNELERRIGGRVGVELLDTTTGAHVSHRCNERFAMCSTFKWVLVAVVLQLVDSKKLTLSQRIEYSHKDLLEYSPVTRQHVENGTMTLEELAEAALTVSDNTAANLLLDRIGGTTGFNRFLREHGDRVTRLDRNEPTLNMNDSGDPRDTTTPAAMVETMRTLLTTAVLTDSSRKRLLDWMVASQTGVKRLRAGLPKTWRVGDKTGSGMHGAVNDVAIAWPPNRSPVLMAVYLSESTASQDTLASAHAEIGRLVASLVA
jgi:beta-lactamase class A